MTSTLPHIDPSPVREAEHLPALDGLCGVAKLAGDGEAFSETEALF